MNEVRGTYVMGICEASQARLKKLKKMNGWPHPLAWNSSLEKWCLEEKCLQILGFSSCFLPLFFSWAKTGWGCKNLSCRGIVPITVINYLYFAGFLYTHRRWFWWEKFCRKPQPAIASCGSQVVFRGKPGDVLMLFGMSLPTCLFDWFIGGVALAWGHATG